MKKISFVNIAFVTLTLLGVHQTAFAHPAIITHDITNLDDIQVLSKFRSGSGHDYRNNHPTVEMTPRSMKHYYNVYSNLSGDNHTVPVYAPCAGTITRVEDEQHIVVDANGNRVPQGKQISIMPDGYGYTNSSIYELRIFHVNLDNRFPQYLASFSNPDDNRPNLITHVNSGELLGYADLRKDADNGQNAGGFDVAVNNIIINPNEVVDISQVPSNIGIDLQAVINQLISKNWMFNVGGTQYQFTRDVRTLQPQLRLMFHQNFNTVYNLLLMAESDYYLISYFDIMPDLLFTAYQARGVSSRNDLIISKEYRDANPVLEFNYLSVTRDQLVNISSAIGSSVYDWLLNRNYLYTFTDVSGSFLSEGTNISQVQTNLNAQYLSYPSDVAAICQFLQQTVNQNRVNLNPTVPLVGYVTISGVVKDQSGNPLSNMSVVYTNNQYQGSIISTTDSQGHYSFSHVPAGGATVNVPSYLSLIGYSINQNFAADAQLNFSLRERIAQAQKMPINTLE